MRLSTKYFLIRMHDKDEMHYIAFGIYTGHWSFGLAKYNNREYRWR